ncbi:hypothetical protein [Phytohabitans aurantiacus]|uniref:Class II aldolase/adducin N-terminal domain-containing protein n=1 Tax=Phytohabitans aurantiacus TaxID=3016789 RepID=A0ABQ5R631_9ACTN|nr:hypothetical protein [Phytohabitans aurantiacus]GLI02229.1 hypothetical protein Pa4123_75070 [Phytohabitans aurantiacus]
MADSYDYATKLTREEAAVDLVVHDRLGVRDRLVHLAGEAARRYGFSLNRLSAPPASRELARGLHHLMTVWDGPLDDALLDATSGRLGEAYDTASIAFAYPDVRASRDAIPAIDAVKRATGDRLNIIRPDLTLGETFLVSNFKIVDAMIAESVRVRYQPHRAGTELPPGLRDRVLPFFRAASERIKAHQLWHRGPGDGCIAVRTDEGLVVTATRTCKAPLDESRLVLVERYDEASNVLTYRGPALPSADSVELFVLTERLPHLWAFIHTHASRQITRNPAFERGLRLGRRPCGEPALGHEMARLLRSRGHGLVVIEEHGEIFIGSQPPEEYFAWLDETLATTRP